MENAGLRSGRITPIRFLTAENGKRGKLKVDDTPHIDEESLEMFVMDRLGAEEANTVLEHILRCGPCNQRLAEVRDYVKALQEALRRELRRSVN
jgi:hypothetical protein